MAHQISYLLVELREQDKNIIMQNFVNSFLNNFPRLHPILEALGDWVGSGEYPDWIWLGLTAENIWKMGPSKSEDVYLFIIFKLFPYLSTFLLIFLDLPYQGDLI